MVARQKKDNNNSRVKDPSGGGSTPNNLHFQVDGDGSGEDIIRHQFRDILPHITGTIPAGKLSVILGPTACGKSTLLNLIRKGGKHATGGLVEVKLVDGGGGGASVTPPSLTPSTSQNHFNAFNATNSMNMSSLNDSRPNSIDYGGYNSANVQVIEFHRPASISSVQSGQSGGGQQQQRSVSGTVIGSGAVKRENPRTLTPSDLSTFIGYVPQEDILDRDLTIRELLAFNVRSRRPEVTSQTEIDSILSSVLSDLAIQHVADSIIGGGENLSANISGGQLKRVNIAVELVALSSPALLLLDEPTAGLDAAIAYDLILSLETVMRHK
eukprot:gene23122-29315_t